LSAVPTPFAGGAIGYLGYELGGVLERLPQPKHDTLDLPSMVIGFYDVVIAFDHVEHKAWIFSSGFPEQNCEASAVRAEARADAIVKKLDAMSRQSAIPDWTARGTWRAGLERKEIERRIARVVEYIRAGDIFQANFTQRFEAACPKGLSDFMLYRRLRALNPAPFAAFMRSGNGLSIAGASPELFLRLRANGVVEAHPIKGTRPRVADSKRDAALADELRASEKDCAENLMIVDLMRSDLSRVCETGSVYVPQLHELESFASVHHLTSVIMGRMQDGKGPVDLLRASFPGGSITGAPKIRAMEIIYELETAPRGIYCGCLGWIGFDGAMDMSMTIRTLTISGDTILAQAGGGIVADSDPAAEYEESMVKIAPLLQAVTGKDA
jgi:para-aminobenzoate synthetase component 1